jgi:4'-phosphopantetheinyl transferase
MPGNETLWRCALSEPQLLPADVQVWAAWLDVNDERLAGFWSTFSLQEQERAARLVLERDRGRFVAARGLLRSILGSCLGTEPHKVEFAYSAKGKPALGGAHATHELQFNLAHSGGLGLFVVARQGLVGVDVEELRPIPDVAGLAAPFFSARESAEINNASGGEQARQFFKLWTRKEAWLKAAGEGITGPLNSFDVLAPPGVLPVRFHLHELTPAPGYLGALAVSPR